MNTKNEFNCDITNEALIFSFNKEAKYTSPSQNNFINKNFLFLQLATYYIQYSFTMSPLILITLILLQIPLEANLNLNVNTATNWNLA